MCLCESNTYLVTGFKLNKQSAYVGRATLDSESLLGPIVAKIVSDEIDEVINWLAPEVVRSLLKKVSSLSTS